MLFRFSLKKVLVTFVMLALALTALLNATHAWAVASVSVVILLLLLCVLAWRTSSGRRREFFFGASLFGWAWLALWYVPPFEGEIRPIAAANSLSDYTYGKVKRNVLLDPGPTWTQAPQDAQFAPAKNGRMTYWLPVHKYFRIVFHSLMALLFGVLGGLLGLSMAYLTQMRVQSGKNFTDASDE